MRNVTIFFILFPTLFYTVKTHAAKQCARGFFAGCGHRQHRSPAITVIQDGMSASFSLPLQSNTPLRGHTHIPYNTLYIMTNDTLSTDNIRIFEATDYTRETLEAVNRLLPQLDPDARPVSRDDLRSIVASANSRLFLASIDGTVAAMCTLCFYRSPTGRKAWIEDVVTDARFRGRGLARMLVDHAIVEAQASTPYTLMLTSRPARAAANRLYRSMRFVQKETNVYKMEFK